MDANASEEEKDIQRYKGYEEIAAWFKEDKFPDTDSIEALGVIVKNCWHVKYQSAVEVHRDILAIAMMGGLLAQQKTARSCVVLAAIMARSGLSARGETHHVGCWWKNYILLHGKGRAQQTLKASLSPSA